ncbi:hypothetical protein [Reichenbachiella sp.]|uniref:hypothetical protein n=1 Tax=Reichenbachiella sp. TaxID=2184521 RepID=UPI003297526D
MIGVLAMIVAFVALYGKYYYHYKYMQKSQISIDLENLFKIIMPTFPRDQESEEKDNELEKLGLKGKKYLNVFYISFAIYLVIAYTI